MNSWRARLAAFLIIAALGLTAWGFLRWLELRRGYDPANDPPRLGEAPK